MMTFLGSKGDLLAQIKSDTDVEPNLFRYQAFPSIETLAQLTEQEVNTEVEKIFRKFNTEPF